MLSTAPPALQILVRSLRIDSPNTGTPPRWAIITHRREIHPKRARHQYYGELVSARPYEMVTFASLIAARAAVERSEWQAPLSRGEVDRCGRGVIDERGKRFSPAERRIAEYLARHGSAVVSVSEGYGVYGRTPDARSTTYRSSSRASTRERAIVPSKRL